MSSEQPLDMSWDVLELGSPIVDSTTTSQSSTSSFLLGFEEFNGSEIYGSPESLGECVTSNTGTIIADRSVKRRSTTPTSATLSPPRKFNVWRQCE
jgi:hypothetical protein